MENSNRKDFDEQKRSLLIGEDSITSELCEVLQNKDRDKVKKLSGIMQTNTQENIKPNMDTEEMPKQEQMK